MKITKMILAGSIIFAPAMVLGIPQQDPATPQQLQQDQATAAQPSQDLYGTIVEVRDDSFSVRKDSDHSVVWFAFTPELRSASSSEILTGNHVRVTAMPGTAADRWNASSVRAEALNADKDVDIDADINVDKDSATATIATNDNDLRNDNDTYETDSDRDELPKTASPLPEIGSLGLLALLGAAAVAFARKL